MDYTLEFSLRKDHFEVQAVRTLRGERAPHSVVRAGAAQLFAEYLGNNGKSSDKNELCY